MKKKWSTISQVIAVALFMWSVYFVLNVFSALDSARQTGKHYQLINENTNVYGKFIQSYHIILIIALISIFGGAGLLFEKKLGWMAALTSCLVYMGFMMVSARDKLAPQNPIVSNQSMTFMSGTNQAAAPVSHTLVGLSYMAAALIFLTAFIILVLKPFRQKYQPTLLNWLLIAAVVVGVLIDKALF